MEANEIELGDLKLLARSESPDLASAVLAFLDQPDPELDREPPQGALTQQGLMAAVRGGGLRYKPLDERRKLVQETWARFLKQTDPPPPPRFQLADLLCEIYQQGGDAGRAALCDIVRQARLRFGLWAGLKRIYKLSEERLDAEMFGILAWRFDSSAARGRADDVAMGTMVYLRRRAWRFLRLLAASVPELYPQFAGQVLRHYQDNTRFPNAWLPCHIMAHEQRKHFTPYRFTGSLPADLIKHRAFDEAWKRSADPLLLLLETCQSDVAARFAIQGLKRDFPETLRNVTPAWLSRLPLRPLGGVHEFLVETLQGSPEFHQGKLRDLGLHETVLSLLLSPSAKARTYAIEYARAHAQDLSDKRLADLIEEAPKETKAFAVAVLKGRSPRALGPAFLGRLLSLSEISDWAGKALSDSFDRKELPEPFLADMLFGDDDQREWVTNHLKKKYQPGEITPAFWQRMLDDRRAKEGSSAYEAVEVCTDALAKFPVASLGAAWLLDALFRDELRDSVSEWLGKADSLPGLDVERVKGLVFHPRYRKLALQLLENTKLIRPRDLTLSWLLALARRADPTLHEFAHRYLLQHMKAEDFSETQDRDAREAGVARLFALATGDKEPEPVRLFAQTYLRCHHPGIGKDQPEAKALGLKPQLQRAVYTAERIFSSLFDARPDVRRFAVVITRVELRRWGYQGKVYDLAESDAKEVRNIAYDATLKAGEPGADTALVLKPEELDPARVFAFTESKKRTTREVGMELIRRHYGRLGGPERLAWLMESPDREVRLFAVRLLWEKHRPLTLPRDWHPAGTKAGSDALPQKQHAGRFADVEALRDFLRRVLFGLPPGRSMEARDDAAVSRRLPASEAKRNVIEIVRDLGQKDADFAQLVAPVLGEFTGSLAKTEWQACLSALMHLSRAHPGMSLVRT